MKECTFHPKTNVVLSNNLNMNMQGYIKNPKSGRQALEEIKLYEQNSEKKQTKKNNNNDALNDVVSFLNNIKFKENKVLLLLFLLY